MTAPSISGLSPTPPGVFGELERNWGWLMLFALACIALGSLGLALVVPATEIAMEFFGAILIIGGVFQVLDALKCRGWKSIVWNLLIALLYIGAGLVLLLQPVLGALSLTMILAYIFILVGVFRAIMAFQLRPTKGWWWPLLSALISIGLGILILLEWPASGLWFIGLFISIELIFHGWSYLFIALAARAMSKVRKSAAAKAASESASASSDR